MAADWYLPPALIKTCDFIFLFLKGIDFILRKEKAIKLKSEESAPAWWKKTGHCWLAGRFGWDERWIMGWNLRDWAGYHLWQFQSAINHIHL